MIISANCASALASGTSVSTLGWKTLAATLAKLGVRLAGWPFSADTPPERHSQKGLAGLPNIVLQTLLDAMKQTGDNALSFIKLSDADRDRKSYLLLIHFN